jgi:hypothetical protein
MGDMVAPEQRVYVYGDYVASVTRSTPPVSTGGRNDPIAMLGRGLADRSSSKTLRKAQKDAAKGKFKKSDSLQSDLKWVSRLFPFLSSLTSIHCLLTSLTLDYGPQSEPTGVGISRSRETVVYLRSCVAEEISDLGPRTCSISQRDCL